MLDLSSVDLDEIAQALDHHSDYGRWWIDADTGEVWLWSGDGDDDAAFDPDLRPGARAIEPLPSAVGYADMETSSPGSRTARPPTCWSVPSPGGGRSAGSKTPSSSSPPCARPGSGSGMCACDAGPAAALLAQLPDPGRLRTSDPPPQGPRPHSQTVRQTGSTPRFGRLRK